MGHSNSKSSAKSPVPEYHPDFEVVRVIDDPNYGRVKLIRENKTHQQMILKEFIFDTKQAYDEELKFFQERASFDHPNMVQVIGYNATHSQNLCSTLFKVAVFIEVLPKELQTTLRERKKNRIEYPEHDLLLIAENIISALHHLQTRNMPHGDIRPVNIFIYGQTFKVTDPRLEIDRNANALTKAIIDKQQTLLAPELLAKLPTGKFETHEDIHKADVFSLGATLLNVATLKNSEDLYDYQAGKLDERLLNERLEEVHANYSEFTYELISHMLRIHVDERPNFIQLKDIIHPYEEAIRRRQDLPFLHTHQPAHPAEVHQQRQGERAKKAAVQIDQDLMHHDDHHQEAPVVHDVNHPEPVFQHHQEPVVITNVRRAEPPQFQDNYNIDDLEAKIRAAMQRTQETYKQVQVVDAYGVQKSDTHHMVESRPAPSFGTGNDFIQRPRQEEKAHSKAPMPLLFEEDEAVPQGRPIERSRDVHSFGENRLKSSMHQPDIQLQHQAPPSFTQTQTQTVVHHPEPQLQNVFSFTEHRAMPPFVPQPDIHVQSQTSNFGRVPPAPVVHQPEPQAQSLHTFGDYRITSPSVHQPDIQVHSQVLSLSGAPSAGYHHDTTSRQVIPEHSAFGNIYTHQPPPPTSFSTTTNYNIGGTPYGYDTIRASTGEHAVRSTPAAHLDYNIGGTSFGHDVIRASTGEHAVRSTPTAHLEDIRRSQDISGHNAANIGTFTHTTTGYTGDNHLINTQPRSPTVDVMTFSHQAQAVDHSPPRISYHDNVTSFNYALGGSPERQRKSMSPQKQDVIIGDTVRTTYGQNEHAYDFGHRGTNLGNQDFHFTTTTDHDLEMRHTNPHTERIVKAFYDSEDAPYIRETHSPQKHEDIHHEDFARVTYGTTTPYGEDRPSGVFRDVGSAVSKYAYVAAEGTEQQQTEFEKSPPRYI